MKRQVLGRDHFVREFADQIASFKRAGIVNDNSGKKRVVQGVAIFEMVSTDMVSRFPGYFESLDGVVHSPDRLTVFQGFGAHGSQEVTVYMMSQSISRDYLPCSFTSIFAVGVMWPSFSSTRP